MGDAVEKLSGKLGIDTTDFKTGISAANRELRVLETSFKASAASLGDWTKDATGLESRIKSLTDQIDIQKLKVAALRENYEKMASENGANSKAAQEAEIKLNQETATLGRMTSELGNTESALSDLSNAENDAGDGADEASGQFLNMQSVLSGMGTIVKGAMVVVAGLATAVSAAGAAISKLVFDTATASAELVDLSAKTGISTTRLQELKYVGDQVGTSQETIVGSLAKLTKTMGEAQKQQEEFTQKQKDSKASWVEIREAQIKAKEAGDAYDAAIIKYGDSSEEAAKAAVAHVKAQEQLSAVLAGDEIQLGDSAAAFEKLGIKITDSNGKLRDNEAVLADAIDALGSIENEAERDALAMSIFGKSAQELNPLIKAGSDELAKLSEKAHEVGAVMSEEDVAAFEAFDDTLASLKAGLQGTLGTLAASFLPGFQSFFDQAGGYLTQFSDIVKNSNGDFGAMAEGVGGLVTQIVTDIAAQAPALLETGVTILQSIVQALLGALPTLIPAAVNIILTLLGFIIDNLPMLIEAGFQAIITLAKGLADALPTLIPAIVQAIITIVNVLLENMPMLIDAALQLILGLAQGLIIALPILIAALPQIIDALFNGLLAALPLMMDASGQLIGMLATGIVAAIPVLILAISELIVRLGVSLGNFIKEAPMHGKNFVTGLVNGIKNASGLLFDAVSTMIKGMIQKIKDLLNMHSPSGVGLDIGENLIGSVGLGGLKGTPKAGDQMANAAQQLVNKMQVAMTGGPGLTPALAGAASGGGGIAIGDIYVDARGATDPQAVGNAVSDSVLRKLRSLGGA